MKKEFPNLHTPLLKLRTLDRQIDSLWEKYREIKDEIMVAELFPEEEEEE